MWKRDVGLFKMSCINYGPPTSIYAILGLGRVWEAEVSDKMDIIDITSLVFL